MWIGSGVVPRSAGCDSPINSMHQDQSSFADLLGDLIDSAAHFLMQCPARLHFADSVFAKSFMAVMIGSGNDQQQRRVVSSTSEKPSVRFLRPSFQHPWLPFYG